MRKHLIVLTALLLTACGTQQPTSSGETALPLTLRTEQLQSLSGAEATLLIRTAAGTDWQSLSLNIVYDPSELELIDIDAPGHLGELQIVAPGQAIAVIQRQGSPAPLKLRARKLTDRVTEVRVQANGVVVQEQGRSVQDGPSVAAVRGPATQTYTPSQLSTLHPQTFRTLPVPLQIQAQWAARPLGDVNLDGRVSLLDTRVLVQGLLGSVALTDVQRYAADLKDDGTVNEEDLALLALKLGLQTYNQARPLMSVHPRSVTTTLASPAPILVGNAGTGVLNSQATTTAAWMTLRRRVEAGAEVWETVLQPSAVVGQTGEVIITAAGRQRRVTVKVGANPDTTQAQRAAFSINTREAVGAVAVLSPFEEVGVDAPGILTFIRGNDASVLYAKNAANEVVAMDVLTAGVQEAVTFNAERSAVALVLTSPGMVGVAGPQRAALAQSVLQHPGFAALVQTIRTQGRLLMNDAELGAANSIARDLVDQALQKNNLSAQQVEDAVQQLLQVVYDNSEVVAITPSFSLQGGLSPLKVECQFKLSTLLTVTQQDGDIKVTNRSTLGVNAYLVPADAKIGSFGDVLKNSVGMAYLSPPDPVTGIGIADWMIGLAGSRNDSFSDNDVQAQLKAKGLDPKTEKFKVVAVSTRLGGNDGNYVNTASTVNVLTALNTFAQVLGIGFDGKQIGKLAQGPAALGILRAFNTAVVTGDFGLALQDLRLAKTASERSEKLGNLFTSGAAFFRENAELFSGLLKEAGADFIKNASFTESVDKAVARMTTGGIAKVATGANFVYAAGNLAVLGSAFVNEQNGRYAEATVTQEGSASEGSGCAPPPPAPPTNPPPPVLPAIPPSDAPDPDEGRGNGNGSGDGGRGPTLPLPRTPGRASSFGDPHLSTFEQQIYSFQAAGEFILSDSLDDSFEVQARYTPLGTEMSANAAIAMRVVGDQVGLYATKDTTPRIVVNGEEVRVQAGQPFFRPLPFGGTVAFDGAEAMVTWPDGSHLTAFLGQNILGRVTLTVPPERAGRLTGLLGNFDGDTTNDYQTRSGQVLTAPVPTPTLYNVFGESWRIQPEESLFDYAPGESTYTFTNRSFPARYAGLHSLTADQQANALNICKQAGILSEMLLKKCTVDVGITGNPDWAYYSAGVDPNLPELTIVPLTAQMLTGTTREFSGLVSGPQRLGNRDIIWSATGGTVLPVAGGVRFTAPDSPGRYELTATSVADPSLNKTVMVNVQAPVIIQGTTRFILKWGEQPADLDAHLWLPESRPYHVYYGRRGADALDVCPSANLDVDDADGYGPEVLKATRLLEVDGMYHVLVRNSSEVGTFAQAAASLEIVDERGLVNTITPPAGDGLWWHVLTMDARTGAINLINTVGEYFEPYADTGQGCDGSGEPPQNTGAKTAERAANLGKPIWTPGVKRIR